MMVKHYIAVYIAGLLMWTNFAHAQSREMARMEFLVDSLSKAYTAQPNTHALTIGVLDGWRSQAYSFGAIDPDDNRLADARTVFEIGPVSQTITATLLTALADSGFVDLDQPITAYLPDSLQYNQSLASITLKNLANHTSGLPDLAALPNLQNTDSVQSFSKANLYDYLVNYQAATDPGMEYKYSELGYALIGCVLTDISSMTFEELLWERFNTPLGLENTGTLPYADQDYAMSHLINSQTILPGTYDAFAGSIGIKSSLRDMLLFVRAHFTLAESAIEQALAGTRQFTFYLPPETDLGLAWKMHLNGINIVYSYGGDGNGSSTYVSFAPDTRKAIIILTNSAEPIGEMGEQLMQALLKITD